MIRISFVAWLPFRQLRLLRIFLTFIAFVMYFLAHILACVALDGNPALGCGDSTAKIQFSQ